MVDAATETGQATSAKVINAGSQDAEIRNFRGEMLSLKSDLSKALRGYNDADAAVLAEEFRKQRGIDIGQHGTFQNYIDHMAANPHPDAAVRQKLMGDTSTLAKFLEHAEFKAKSISDPAKMAKPATAAELYDAFQNRHQKPVAAATLQHVDAPKSTSVLAGPMQPMTLDPSAPPMVPAASKPKAVMPQPAVPTKRVAALPGDNSLHGELDALLGHYADVHSFDTELANLEKFKGELSGKEAKEFKETLSAELQIKRANSIRRASTICENIIKTSPPERQAQFREALVAAGGVERAKRFLGEIETFGANKVSIGTAHTNEVKAFSEKKYPLPEHATPDLAESLSKKHTPPTIPKFDARIPTTKIESWWAKPKTAITKFTDKKKFGFMQVLEEARGDMLGYFRLILVFPVVQVGIGALINIFRGRKEPDLVVVNHASNPSNNAPPPAGQSKGGGEGQTSTAAATAVATSSTVTAEDMQKIEAKKKQGPRPINWGQEIVFYGTNIAVVVGSLWATDKLLFTPFKGTGRSGGEPTKTR